MQFLQNRLPKLAGLPRILAICLTLGAFSSEVLGQDGSAQKLKEARQQIVSALKNQKSPGRSITGSFELQSTGVGKNKKVTTSRTYEFGLDGPRFFLAILDNRINPTDKEPSHRQEYVSDGTSFFEVVQARSGGNFVMRQFESKPDQGLVGYYRFLPESNRFFMRGLPLLAVLESDSFQFTKIEILKGEFGEEWTLEFRMKILDCPYRTGVMTVYAEQGFLLKNLSARPAAPFNAELMSMEWGYRMNEQKELIPAHARIEDSNAIQTFTFKDFRSVKEFPESRFKPDHFDLPDPRKVKSSMIIQRPMSYFLASTVFFIIATQTRRTIRQEARLCSNQEGKVSR